MEQKEQDAVNIIKKFGLKLTPARIDILKLLSKDETPISAELIHKKLRGKYDLATIYRNMSIFVQRGVVFLEAIGHSDRYYLSNSEHHHIVCRSCDIVECLPCEHHEEKINVKGFTDVSHNLVLTGLCKKCRRHSK